MQVQNLEAAAMIIGQFVVVLLVYIFIIKRLTKNKPWYYRVPILLALAFLIPFVMDVYIAEIICRNTVEVPCGLGEVIWAMLVGASLAAIAIAITFRKFIEKKWK